jgi:radical SAM superfamily enzyme YgiQ (UPF0313 family)
MDLKNIKLKTLLIFPPEIEKLKKTKNNFEKFLAGENSPPLGMAKLVGYLKKIGYKNIKSIDLRTDKNFKNNLNQFAKNIKTDIVGISAVYNIQLPAAIKLANAIRRHNKKIFILIGGNAISDNLEYLINNPIILRSVDAIIFGDGEKPLEKIIYHLGTDKKLYSVPNIIYNDKKSLKKSGHLFRCSKNFIDILPDFTKINSLPFIPLKISIGCYWRKCTFCAPTRTYPKYPYQIATIESTLNIIKQLNIKYNKKRFVFFDDSIPPHYLEQLSKELIKRKFNIQWEVKATCLDAKFINKKLVSLLKKSGCQEIGFGMESFSPKILKQMNKIHTVQNALKILKLFKEEKIKTNIHILFGFPGETIRDVKTTLASLKKYNNLYEYFIINYFRLYKNSYIHKNPLKFNITDKKDIKDYGFAVCGFKNRNEINYEKLKILIKKFNLENKATELNWWKPVFFEEMEKLKQ